MTEDKVSPEEEHDADAAAPAAGPVSGPAAGPASGRAPEVSREPLGRIRRASSLVQTRMRLARVLSTLSVAGPVAVLLAGVVLALHKLGGSDLGRAALRRTYAADTLDRAATVGWVALGVLLIGALLLAYLLPLPRQAGARALEKVHGLEGRLSNALAFASLPAPERTPFMEAAIDEACAYVAARPRKQTLATGKAAPLLAAMAVAPVVAAMFWLLSLGVLGAIAMLELPVKVPPPPAPPPQIAALELSADDLDLLRESAKELARDNQTPEVKAALDQFNQLIEDIAAKRLEREEAFRRMEAIERALMEGAEADRKKLENELAETAKQLEKSELTRDTAKALEKQDLKKAEEELKKLAQDLKNGKKKFDKADLQKLRDALKKAAEKRKENLEAINQRRAELREQLLKKKKQVEEEKNPEKKREEERLLRKQERELERLDRDAEAQARANKELERLDRELSEAAQDLMRDLGITQEDLQKAAEDLEQAAEDMNRLQEESMSQKDKEELKKKLEELREILRQEKQGGKQRKARMVKFSKRARGGKPSQGGQEGEEGDEGENGKEGQGKKGSGEGEDGEGEGENGQRPGGKKKGSGLGDGDIELSLGPGGVPIPMPGGGGQPGEQPGGGSEPGGKGWGTGKGGDVAGKKTDSAFDTMDVQQQGLEANGGPTNSKTIQSAAEKGFRGDAYKKVFTDYKTVAEDNIDKEQIPDGYRFYVQRYFQLIRPRE